MVKPNSSTGFSAKSGFSFAFPKGSRSDGIEYKDFISAVWYQREVLLTDKQLMGRTFIHFGAVDYEAHVFINDAEVGKHIGGYSSFTFDITDYVKEGENTITVYAIDDVRSGAQPRGKQAESFYSAGCDYTRTTGIWQSVILILTINAFILTAGLRERAP